jgi:hypothetical protein
MNMSDDIAELATALSKAQGEILDAAKAAENPYFKSKYADLAAVRGVIREPMAKHGLSLVQLPKTVDGGVMVETMLLHSSGQYIKSALFMPAAKSDAHGIGSAITYARRYSIMSILSLATEDDDGNAAVDSVKHQPAKPAPASDAVLAAGAKAAIKGNAALTAWWNSLSESVRKTLPAQELANLKKIAADNNSKGE